MLHFRLPFCFLELQFFWDLQLVLNSGSLHAHLMQTPGEANEMVDMKLLLYELRVYLKAILPHGKSGKIWKMNQASLLDISLST